MRETEHEMREYRELERVLTQDDIDYAEAMAAEADAEAYYAQYLRAKENAKPVTEAEEDATNVDVIPF